MESEENPWAGMGMDDVEGVLPKEQSQEAGGENSPGQDGTTAA